jgi:antitoxin ParD1/3/4
MKALLLPTPGVLPNSRFHHRWRETDSLVATQNARIDLVALTFAISPSFQRRSSVSRHMSDPQAAKDEWPSAEQKAKNIAQAKALRVQAEKGGLRFSAYLPPGLADWLLGLIEKGTFHDPNEAVFVILGEHQDLESHTDLWREILARSWQSDLRPTRGGGRARSGRRFYAEIASASYRSRRAIDSRERDVQPRISQIHLHEGVHPRLGQIQATRVCSRDDCGRDCLRR